MIIQYVSFLLLVLTCSLCLGSGSDKHLQYFSSFTFGETFWKSEHLITDYVILSEDPKANLPDSFTICNSLLVKFVSTNYDVVGMLKHDGSPWFSLELGTMQRNYEQMSETLLIFYENPATGSSGISQFTSVHIPIVPHSWYHVCMGLDTVSGLLRIVVNGILVVNEVKDYFRNTKSWKPRSIENKILLFKAHKNGFWSQQKSAFSNLNIFGSMITVEDMEKRTSGGDTCAFPGDYLRYKQPCNTAMICTYLF